MIVEKDCWVSWTLDKLFHSLPNQPDMIFKGGTSLSKGYQLIDRFSEDIDITFVRQNFGFAYSDDEVLDLGNKRRKRYFNELEKITIETIQNCIEPDLNKIISENISEKYKLDYDPSDQQRLIFEYPSCYAS